MDEKKGQKLQEVKKYKYLILAIIGVILSIILSIFVGPIVGITGLVGFSILAGNELRKIYNARAQKNINDNNLAEKKKDVVKDLLGNFSEKMFIGITKAENDILLNYFVKSTEEYIDNNEFDELKEFIEIISTKLSKSKTDFEIKYSEVTPEMKESYFAFVRYLEASCKSLTILLDGQNSANDQSKELREFIKKMNEKITEDRAKIIKDFNDDKKIKKLSKKYISIFPKEFESTLKEYRELSKKCILGDYLTDSDLLEEEANNIMSKEDGLSPNTSSETKTAAVTEPTEIPSSPVSVANVKTTSDNSLPR